MHPRIRVGSSTPVGLVQPAIRFRLRVRDADPDDHQEGAEPFPPTGYRQLDARRWYFYGVTGITPAMAMRVTGIGSQYLFATLDADKNYFDGAKTYKVTLPKGIPARELLVVHALRQPDALDARHAAALPARRQSELSDACRKTEPRRLDDDVFWFETARGCETGELDSVVPGKGWFAILRLYSPLEPFFTKEWRPSEIQLVN